MAALQAALDDWYAMELADAEKALNDKVPPTGSALDKWKQQKADALKGLGDPKDGGAAAKAQQKKNSDKDFEDLKKKKEKGKKPKDILKDKIAKALKDLQDCEASCPEGDITPTPTPTAPPVDDGGKSTVQPPPVFDIQIPPLPPCFDSEEARQAHRDKLEELQKKLTTIKKKYGVEFAEPPNKAWKEFKDKWEDAIKDLNNQLFPGADGKSALDKVKVPCPSPTPTPSGGGGGKTGGPGKGKPKKPGRVATGGNVSLPTETFCALITDNKIKIEITGTGETIGHIAEVRISNQTDEPIEVTIPPVVLESRSGKNQNYGVPHTTEVALKSHEAKTIPLDGVCLDRHKPPVGKGIGDDLAFVDCDPDPRIEQDDSDRMLRIAEGIYEAADKLEGDGKLKEMPYKDPKKRKEIVEQWATWVRVSEVTGDPPPTKDDLKKVVEKQVGKVPPDKKKKIDEGIDTIWDKIELTTDKAKDYDKPEGETVEETPPVGQPEYIGQGHTYAKKPTPTPSPPKPKGGGTKTKPTPTPTSTPTPTPTPKEKGPGTQTKPTPTPTPTPNYKDPPDTVKPLPVKYPQKKKIDCGDIEIAMGTKGDLIFEFKPNGKCPCKKFGWIQHFRFYPGDADNPVWHYDNGTYPTVSHGGSGIGAISHPDQPKQPTKRPDGLKEDDFWQENPWYGGTDKPEEEKNGFAQNPKSKETVHDKPTHPGTTFRMQLVCVDTGEVLFTWAWGPYETGNESPDKVGGVEIPPPPLKK